jgi:hypothetical protein
MKRFLQGRNGKASLRNTRGSCVADLRAFGSITQGTAGVCSFCNLRLYTLTFTSSCGGTGCPSRILWSRSSCARVRSKARSRLAS